MYVCVCVCVYVNICMCTVNREIFLLCPVLISYNPMSHSWNMSQVRMGTNWIHTWFPHVLIFSMFCARKSNNTKAGWTGHSFLRYKFYASFEAHSGKQFWGSDAVMVANNHGPLNFRFSSQGWWPLPSWVKLTPTREGPSVSTNISFLFFFFKIIYLFIFGCVGSSFVCEGFL